MYWQRPEVNSRKLKAVPAQEPPHQTYHYRHVNLALVHSLLLYYRF